MPRKHSPEKNKSGSLQPLRTVRQSGLPVLPSHLKAYTAEFATIFDKIQAHLGVTDSSILTEEQASRFQKLLDRLDKKLRRYYPCEVAWPFLTYTAYQRKLREYECDIIISFERTSGHLIYVIADEEAAMKKAQAEQENQPAALGYVLKDS